MAILIEYKFYCLAKWILATHMKHVNGIDFLSKIKNYNNGERIVISSKLFLILLTLILSIQSWKSILKENTDTKLQVWKSGVTKMLKYIFHELWTGQYNDNSWNDIPIK